ncbi:12707_t:CDS:2, partial [Ambispora leptoticha]
LYGESEMCKSECYRGFISVEIFLYNLYPSWLNRSLVVAELQARRVIMWTNEHLRLLIDEKKTRNIEYYDIMGISREDFWNSVADKILHRIPMQGKIPKSQERRRNRTPPTYEEVSSMLNMSRRESPADNASNVNDTGGNSGHNANIADGNSGNNTNNVGENLGNNTNNIDGNLDNVTYSSSSELANTTSNLNTSTSRSDSDLSMSDVGDSQPPHMEPINEEGGG